MTFIEVTVFADNAHDTRIISLVLLDSDVPLVFQALDLSLHFPVTSPTKHVHEMVVRGYAAKIIIEGKNLAPQELVITI